jgi:hypothetical protein
MKRIIFVLTLALLVFGASMVNAQAKKIGMKRARQIAMQHASGKIKSSELEKEKGRWIYSFDIRNNKGTITEVNIDAFSGKVVGVEKESVKKEAAEDRNEKKKN